MSEVRADKHHPSSISHLNGGVLLTEERIKGERERHLSDVSRKNPKGFEKPVVKQENKNKYFERLFNRRRKTALKI